MIERRPGGVRPDADGTRRRPAFDSFVTMQWPSLLRCAYLITGNESDAEDAVQEALLSVSSRYEQLDPVTATAYVRRAVTNKAIDLTRRRRPLLGRPSSEADGYVDGGLLRYEEDQVFLSQLQKVPGRQRAALVLRFYFDLTDDAVADLLDCSPATVRSQIHRGLKRLRSWLITTPPTLRRRAHRHRRPREPLVSTPEERLRRLAAHDDRWNQSRRTFPGPVPASRVDEPRRPGPLLLAAVVTVLALAGAGLAVGHSSHRSADPNVSSPKKSGSVIPWTPIPPRSLPGDVASPPRCDTANLAAHSQGGDSAMGSFNLSIEVRNSGPLCSLPNASVTLRTHTDGGPDTILATAAESGRPSDPHLVAAHSSVSFHASFDTTCRPTRRPGPRDPTMSIGVAGRDVPVTGTTLQPELASCKDVSLQGSERAVNEADPYPQLTVSLALPASAEAGTTLAYTVKLTNRSTKPFTFRACPNYYQNVGGAKRASTVTVYGLNCRPMKPLAQGKTMTFAMRTRLPPAPGATDVTWHLKYYSGPSAAGTVLLE